MLVTREAARSGHRFAASAHPAPLPATFGSQGEGSCSNGDCVPLARHVVGPCSACGLCDRGWLVGQITHKTGTVTVQMNPVSFVSFSSSSLAFEFSAAPSPMCLYLSCRPQALGGARFVLSRFFHVGACVRVYITTCDSGHTPAVAARPTRRQEKDIFMVKVCYR